MPNTQKVPKKNGSIKISLEIKSTEKLKLKSKKKGKSSLVP